MVREYACTLTLGEDRGDNHCDPSREGGCLGGGFGLELVSKHGSLVWVRP